MKTLVRDDRARGGEPRRRRFGQQPDKLTFTTNWFAEAEHGGFTRWWRRGPTASTGWR